MQRDSLASITLQLAALALFASWLMPGHYHPWISFQNEVAAALGGLLLAAAALLASASRVAWPSAGRVAALVAAIPALQYAFGQISFRSDALMAVLYPMGLALAISVGATHHQWLRRRFIDYLFGILVAAGVVSTGLALTQWLNIGPIGWIEWTPPGVRPFANLGQPNHLGSLLALATLGVLWLYETRRIDGPSLWLAALWLGSGMALTRSRMVLVAVVVIALGWLLLRRRFETRLQPRHLAAWLLLFALLNASVNAASELLSIASPQSITERVQASGGRLRIWATLLDSLIQSPWVGYGWSQVSRASLAGSLDHFTGEAMLRNSHSFPLDLLLWNGIPLGLLLIGLIAMWWLKQLRNCDSAERAVVLGAVGVVTVHCLFEFPLEYFYYLVPLGLFVGVLESWSESAPPAPRWAGAVSLAGTVTLSAVGLAITTEYLTVEQASRDGRMRSAGYIVTTKLPEPILLDEPLEYVRFWRTEAKAGMSAEELDWMQRMAGRNPAPPTLLRYATALGLNGQPEAAARTLVRLCNMHSAVRCDEGRASWAQLQQTFPVLGGIAYPSTPSGR